VPENSHTNVTTACAHCHRDILLVCEGLSGYPGYLTYHDYECPHCRKLNHERTPGAIVEVRPGPPRASAA
jgi:hypothetical protein